MTDWHYPGQWSMCGSLCPYESVTPKPCSWGSLILTTWHIPSYDHIYSVYDPISHALSYGVIYRVYRGIYFSQMSVLSISRYILFRKVYDVIYRVYRGIGISRYMMVHDRHMSVYDKYSVLILVIDTDVPGTRTLISGTCVLILPNSVPGCCCDWYMLAHPALLFFRLHPAGPPECGTFVAPERHAR